MGRYIINKKGKDIEGILSKAEALPLAKGEGENSVAQAGCTATGKNSFAEGKGTVTTNVAEHAEGRYNKSTKNITIHSIGIGADNDNRKNAFEVSKTGGVYVLNLGGYNGTNVEASASIQNVITSLMATIETLKTRIATLEDIISQITITTE